MHIVESKNGGNFGIASKNAEKTRYTYFAYKFKMETPPKSKVKLKRGKLQTANFYPLINNIKQDSISKFETVDSTSFDLRKQIGEFTPDNS